MSRRVVITGMGVVSPVGSKLDVFWNNLCNGVSGIEKIPYFDVENLPVKIAGTVKDYNPEDYIDRKECRKMDKFVQFAMGASLMAMEDAALDMSAVDATRVGAIIGSGIGGIITFEEQHKTLLERGASRVSPFFIPMMISDMAAGQVAIKVGAKGPNYACVSACASAAHSVGDAFKSIKDNESDVIITGGSEAAVCPTGLAGFTSAKALTTRNDPPQKASCPFDKKRDGFVMGEGAGIVILEALEHAKSRNAKIYGEIMGYGYTDDACHITQPAPEGEGAARSMKIALESSGIAPNEVDYINAHGTSTPLNDKNETAAIKSVFGEHAKKLKISSTKSMTGHLLGATAALELMSAALAIRDSKIPPTINYEDPDPECDLDYTPNKSAEIPVNCAISNSFGFGGHNATLAIRKYTD